MKDYKLKQRNLRASHTLSNWVGLGTGTPKDRDEVNKREVYRISMVVSTLLPRNELDSQTCFLEY
jgi:hypothetical protein